MPHVCECVGVVRSTPVAQTLVLRRVLTGGISMNSGRRFFPGTQYGYTPLCGWWSWNGVWEGTGGLVFGTLLGPEATGPWHHGRSGPPCGGMCPGWWCGTCVSGFLAAPSMHVCVCGVCGMGLLFENYIVDASIFYKKQFPRIMNLDLLFHPSGWGDGFHGSLVK